MASESYSYSLEHPYSYKWFIKDITSLTDCVIDKANTIKSPDFSAGAKIKDSWYLQLTINKSEHYPNRNTTYMVISLSPKNEGREVRAKYSIYLLNNERHKVYPDTDFNNKEFHPSISRIFTTLSHHGILVPLSALLERKDEFIQNDTLAVGVDLTVYDDYVGINNPINSLKGSGRTLADDFKDLFVNKKKCDVVIKVGNEKFDAHKAILIARSCVFDAMFSSDMTENKINEVTIPDIDPKVIKKLIDYIYTDKVDQLDTFGEELLEASDKYQLHTLKEICEDFLAGNLTVANCIRVMILADRHHAKRLKELATTYIIINLPNIKKTEDYKALEESQPSVAVDLLKKYIDEVNSK